MKSFVAIFSIVNEKGFVTIPDIRVGFNWYVMTTVFCIQKKTVVACQAVFERTVISRLAESDGPLLWVFEESKTHNPAMQGSSPPLSLKQSS